MPSPPPQWVFAESLTAGGNLSFGHESPNFPHTCHPSTRSGLAPKLTYRYGKPLVGAALGSHPLYPNDVSTGRRWEPLEPEMNATLWRYLSFAKFCSLVERRELFFALVGDMEDRYEGFVAHPPPRKPGFRRQAERLVLRLLNEIARSALVSCWTEAGHESSLMWNSYAGEEGVAIRTSFHDLQESLRVIDASLPVTFGKVKYIDYGQQQVPRFGWAPLFHKRREYRGEDEVRAVLPGPPWEIHPDPDTQTRPVFLTFRSIRMSPNSEADTSQ